jgi:cation:H+ antiporter
MMHLLWLVLGLVWLVLGGELLVRGSSRLAALAGVSPLIIGLTVVAFGTSSPELAVSLQAAEAGQPEIAVGNVVGSNIFNTLLILGLCALLLPLVIAQQLVRQDVPLMIGASALVMVFAADARISRLEGLVLFLLLVGYVLFSVLQSRKEAVAIRQMYEAEYGEDPPKRRAGDLASQVLLIAAGLVLLVVGARWLVWSATVLARSIGVTDLVIGLTVVAGGTSLPELVTSLVAAWRGQRDIAVGNVVGSNIFNLLGILGITALFSGQGLSVTPSAFTFDMPVMLAAAVACLPVFFTGHVLARWEGALFLAYYVVYTSYLVMTATRHEATGAFATAMWFFVIPLTVITLLVGLLRGLRARS